MSLDVTWWQILLSTITIVIVGMCISIGCRWDLFAKVKPKDKPCLQRLSFSSDNGPPFVLAECAGDGDELMQPM